MSFAPKMQETNNHNKEMTAIMITLGLALNPLTMTRSSWR